MSPGDRNAIDFARQLRRNSTDAEQRIWSRLRGHQLGGFGFRRQHPIAGYVLDFYCHAARLAVELDGGQHTLAEHLEHDARRAEALAAEGVTVLRFTNQQALAETDAVAATIHRELEARVKR